MVDLETMGKGPEAAIVAIGVVEFDLETSDIGRTFYAKVSLESAMEHGGKVDASTVMWWLQQSDEARAELCTDQEHIIDALVGLSRWMRDCCPLEERRVWGNGATFDNVILKSAYENCSFDVPWKHWGDRCYRTVKNMVPDIPLVRRGVHHNALDDALSQAEHLIRLIGKKVVIDKPSVQ